MPELPIKPAVTSAFPVGKATGALAPPNLEYRCLGWIRNFQPQLHVVESDPEDNKFFECAVALQADWIVSGDKAFIAVGNYMAIQVVSPKDFLDRYR